MTPSRRFARLGLSCGRWLLPRPMALSLSITLASTMSRGMVGITSDSDGPDVLAARPTGRAGARSALLSRIMAPPGGGFGMMSTTTIGLAP